ncbi:MAG TPA: acyl-CoA desaturase [Catalimonadaceae bacterium]|nr:acyl-CoA desaturase [Catalimonadaceae bacterium]HPI12415.1 acyl-CoA desaturase [Catalimonadaceae bacterium]
MNIRFEKSNQNFLSILRKQVNSYFEENQISTYGNNELFLKSVILFGLLAVNYFLQVFVITAGTWEWFACYFFQGIVFALIGFNVMHDGSHHSYSSNKQVNQMMAYSLNFLGGISQFWHQKHVINHHTYTNIEGVDDDIDLKPFLRMHSDQLYIPIHKFQAYYAFFLYSLTYVFWIYYRDFKKYFTRKIADDTPMEELTLKDHFVFWITKIVHVFIFIGIPAFFMGPKLAILGYLILCLSCGFTLAIIFQLAHIVEGTIFSSKDENDTVLIGSEWSIHQINTTVNFGTESKVLTWLLGGLNFQMVHHLFPKISHVHYPALHKIICETCDEYNVKYVEYKNFWSAVGSHLRYLNQMGKAV